MARFVSQHRNYRHGVRAHLPERMGVNGVMLPAVPELEAVFTTDLRTDEDLALALSRFAFRGVPIYENGQPANISLRISVFDSEIAARQNGWSDEDEQYVIDVLRGSSHNGAAFIEVVPASAIKPWNGYDEVADVSRIVELAVAIDADLRAVLQYERENQARPDVEYALQRAIEAEEETVIVRA